MFWMFVLVELIPLNKSFEMPFKHKSKAKQEIKGETKYERLKTFPVYTK